MCMEDIRIGRKTRTATRRVLVGTSAIQLSQRSPDRIALIISSPIPLVGAPQTNRVTISTDPKVTDQAGLVFWAGNNPCQFDIQKHGNLVTESLYAIADGANRSIGIIETFLDER